MHFICIKCTFFGRKENTVNEGVFSSLFIYYGVLKLLLITMFRVVKWNKFFSILLGFIFHAYWTTHVCVGIYILFIKYFCYCTIVIFVGIVVKQNFLNFICCGFEFYLFFISFFFLLFRVQGLNSSLWPGLWPSDIILLLFLLLFVLLFLLFYHNSYKTIVNYFSKNRKKKRERKK